MASYGNAGKKAPKGHGGASHAAVRAVPRNIKGSAKLTKKAAHAAKAPKTPSLSWGNSKRPTPDNLSGPGNVRGLRC